MRKQDTGWRDSMLAVRHKSYGFEAPAPGMKLSMIEYDKGEPLALINYWNRNVQLPFGKDVARHYHAFGELHRFTGEQLPFMTAQYDPRNWSFRVFGHNEAAHSFLDTRGWVVMNERQFVNNLYRLRGRHTPDLSSFGVVFNAEGWTDTNGSPDWPHEAWPGSLMSQRRRNYEPVTQVRMSWRNPCVDIDFAVVGVTDHVALIVDYKAPGARVGLGSKNVEALSSLYIEDGAGLPMACVSAMVVKYQPDPEGWRFAVHCANKAASMLLAYVLAPYDNDETTAKVIAGAEWVDLTEAEWKSVLNVARDY